MNLKILTGKLTRGTEGAAGYDIYSSEDVIITHDRPVAVKTNLRIAIPQGYYGKVEARSGLSFNNHLETGAGIIDSDYRGEIKVKIINTGNIPVTLPAGSRIAQIIFMKHEVVEIEEVALLEETARGDNGFGSTGL
ncbi:MAG: dUTP diphosphatase [Fusobacteriaceae bacterium]